MSDNATLVERLRSYELRSAITLEAATRIAELEAEVARWSRELTTAYARTAELEAENARLTSALGEASADIVGMRAQLNRALIDRVHEVGFREAAEAKVTELEAEVARLTAVAYSKKDQAPAHVLITPIWLRRRV